MVDGVNFDPFAGRGGRSMMQAMDDLAPEEREGVVIGEDGSMQFGAFTLLPTGMKINGVVTEDDWQKVGLVLSKMQTSLQWLIGDWCVYGEREYGRGYEEIAEAFGYKVKTLRNLRYVSTRVKMSRHRDKLLFSQAAVFAVIEDGQKRREWLDYVCGMTPIPTVRELRALISGERLLPPPKGVARVIASATKLHGQAERLSKRKENRAELSALADEEIAYWTSIKQQLEQSE